MVIKALSLGQQVCINHKRRNQDDESVTTTVNSSFVWFEVIRSMVVGRVNIHQLKGHN